MHKVKLSEICTIVSGGTPSRAKPEYWQNGTIPWIKIGNINTKWVDSADEYITEAGFNNSSAKMLSKGTILYTIFATLGEFVILKIAACTNQAIAGITINDSEKVIPDYLYYYLKSKKPFVNGIGRGVAQNNINMTILRSFEVPLPNYQDQKIIVDILEKVSTSIELRKRELHSLDTLIKARFVEMFGTYDLALQNAEWIPIAQIGTVVGGSTPKTSVAEYWDGEYRWISPAELKADSGIIYDSVKKITKAGIDSCSLQELPVGTVILSSRAPIGKVAIAGNTFYCNQGFKNIICNDKVLPRYLYTLLLFNTEYLNSLGRGATFKEISKSIVESIRIPLPTIDKQKQFESFVAQVDKSKFGRLPRQSKRNKIVLSVAMSYFTQMEERL